MSGIRNLWLKETLFCVAVVLFAGVSLMGQDEARPLALYPANPHYFQWRGKPTVLVTSGEHYGAVLNLDFNYKVYLQTLAKDGLNHTRTFSGTYREVGTSFGITDNTLAPKSNRYACPWARSDQPGYADGGNKFDLTRYDPDYFKRLKDFLAEADKAGVVVEFNLFCPLYRPELWDVSPMNAKNNINGVGTCPSDESLTLKHADLVDVQLAFARQVAKECNAFDNLYYEICNEPYFGGVAMDWQHKVAETIVATEKDLPKKHLISLNIANGRAEVKDKHSAISILNFHYCVPPDTVAINWKWNVVIGENETGFRGSDDILYRTEAWDFMLAGGALYNNLDYSFTPPHPDGTFSDYRSPGGGSPALRKQLGVLKNFIESFDFIRMQPDQDVIAKIEPKLTVYSLVEDGKQYALNMHVPLENKPKNLQDVLSKVDSAKLTLNLPKGQYAADWMDTKTGETVKQEAISHQGGKCELTSPPFQSDIALRIVAE